MICQRLNVVTLGVADVARSRRFYEALGWRASASQSSQGVAFFQMSSTVLALFGRKALAEDAGVADSAPGFAGVTMAWCEPDRAEVDRALEAALGAGARLVKPAQPTFWGGYSGYFADPDGHLWGVAHNPFWALTADGGIRMPE